MQKLYQEAQNELVKMSKESEDEEDEKEGENES